MALAKFTEILTFVWICKFIISASLGLFGLGLAYYVKRKDTLKGMWFESLKYILTLLSISSLSNAYSIILLGSTHIEPTEMMMNACVLILGLWVWGFYSCNFKGMEGGSNLEGILNHLHREVSGDSKNR